MHREKNTNIQITKELNLTPGLDKIQECRVYLLHHLNRMSLDTLPRIVKTKNEKAQ
jgi:hypothetical protein